MSKKTFPNEFDVQLVAMITLAIRTRAPGDICTLKDLLDEDFFKGTEKGEHRDLGRRVSRLVSAKLLPLEPDGFNSSRHNQYRII